MASTADQGVHRILVDLAQFRRRAAGFGYSAIARGDDPTPVGRWELRRVACQRHDFARGIGDRDEARKRHTAEFLPFYGRAPMRSSPWTFMAAFTETQEEAHAEGD
jgi:hypothetical protein